MKYIFFIGLICSFQEAVSQLVELGTNKHHRESNKGLIYEQFKFRVKWENERYIIKSLANDSVLFDPGRRAFMRRMTKNI